MLCLFKRPDRDCRAVAPQGRIDSFLLVALRFIKPTIIVSFWTAFEDGLLS